VTIITSNKNKSKLPNKAIDATKKQDDSAKNKKIISKEPTLNIDDLSERRESKNHDQ